MDEAGNIIDSAGNLFAQLEKGDVFKPFEAKKPDGSAYSFAEFMEEEGAHGEFEGNDLETIRAFHTLTGVFARYRARAASKGYK